MYDVCIKRQYGRALRASQTKMRGTKLFLGFKLKRKAEGAKYKTVFLLALSNRLIVRLVCTSDEIHLN